MGELIRRSLLRSITYWKFRRLGAQRGLENAHSISTHLTFEEKYQLYALATEASGVFVEIGSYVGASAVYIAAAIERKGDGSKLYCVDTWQNDAMSEGNRDTFSEFKENTKPFKRNIESIRGKSAEVAATFDDKVDFLFVDGDHEYAGVKADVQSWFPKLRDGALVVFHDISWAEGVRQVLDEDVRSRATRDGQLPNLYWAWM